jgi:hypothetical protein
MLSEQQKRDFCAIMLHKYGVALDTNNELLPVFYVAYRAAAINEQTSKQTNDHILNIIERFEKNTAAKIKKLDIKQFRFQNPKEAFWFAFGKYGIATICVSVLISLALWIYYEEEISIQKEDYFFQFMESQVLQKKKLSKSTTVHLFTLSPVDTLSAAEAGKHYVYKKACDCIEVPVYFETQK